MSSNSTDRFFKEILRRMLIERDFFYKLENLYKILFFDAFE